MTDPWQSPAPGRAAGTPIGSFASSGSFGTPPRAQSEPLLRRADLAAAVVSALVITFAGAPAGLIWEAVSPHIDVQAVAAGSEASFRAEIAADGRFFFIALVLGIATGVLAWRFAGGRGPLVPIGIAVGALSAAVIAAQVGYVVRRPALLDLLPDSVPASTLSLVDFRLRAAQVLIVWPVVALVSFLALSAFDGRRA